MANASLPRKIETPVADSTHQNWKYLADGRIDVPSIPKPNQFAPPPPPWLNQALFALNSKYPHDSFDAHMKLYPIDPATNAPVKPDAPPTSEVTYQYLPRIKCNDCPGKLYAAGPAETCENFEVHLRNRAHKERVELRRKGASS